MLPALHAFINAVSPSLLTEHMNLSLYRFMNEWRLYNAA